MSLSCSDSDSVFFADESAFSFSPSLPGDGEVSAPSAFFSSSSLRFFFSCFARSWELVVLVNAIILPFGDHFGSPAPFGSVVNENESPPAIARTLNCGGSGFPSFSIARKKSRYFPSGDQRGEVSCSPLVRRCGWSPPVVEV